MAARAQIHDFSTLIYLDLKIASGSHGRSCEICLASRESLRSEGGRRACHCVRLSRLCRVSDSVSGRADVASGRGSGGGTGDVGHRRRGTWIVVRRVVCGGPVAAVQTGASTCRGGRPGAVSRLSALLYHVMCVVRSIPAACCSPAIRQPFGYPIRYKIPITIFARARRGVL